METALALLQRIVGGKGYEVRSMHLDDGGLLAILGDKSGKLFELKLTAVAELERGEPDRLETAPELAIPASIGSAVLAAATPIVEAMAAEAPKPRQQRLGITEAFDVVRLSADRLSNDAKSILAELRTLPLEPADSETLLAAGAAAVRGDLSHLRALAEKRRPPERNAASPPVDH